MTTSKSRNDLALQEKVKLLKEFEVRGRVTQKSVAVKYGISTSQVSRLVSLKDEIFEQFEDSGNGMRKRQRKSKEEDVGNALFLWLKQKLTQGARISGVILRQKATEIALANGSDFIPSDGWLGRWKLRHDLIYKQEQGENKMLVLKGLKIGRALFFLQSWMILLQKTYLMRRDGVVFQMFS
ncbi:Tigger transposable element-derived protein 4-like isoform X4 [Oopsacas minuta]|uniref:Tigger transposable element-derived protein 4-like isoform X4 n=1 Tax=Oopsacas minuta TaxID=111878 RepID=A0AAV7JLP8_9METZ|nr:Tigger transposable element-derived protein 4-like isoform X4 [Oopsacas minuta]